MALVVRDSMVHSFLADLRGRDNFLNFLDVPILPVSRTELAKIEHEFGKLPIT
jgi:hypothetical protein